jgi:quinol monooxygenase YgiN
MQQLSQNDHQLAAQGVFVTAEVHIKDEVELATGVAAINAFCAAMNSEPGCTLAMALQDPKAPKKFIFWERYNDDTAIHAHFSAPHTQAFIASGLTELKQAFQSQLVEA